MQNPTRLANGRNNGFQESILDNDEACVSKKSIHESIKLKKFTPGINDYIIESPPSKSILKKSQSPDNQSSDKNR